MGRELNSVIGTIAEKTSTPCTDIPVSIPQSLLSVSEVSRLQKNKQMFWNGEVEEEEWFHSQWQEATMECAFRACWYL